MKNETMHKIIIVICVSLILFVEDHALYSTYTEYYDKIKFDFIYLTIIITALIVYYRDESDLYTYGYTIYVGLFAFFTNAYLVRKLEMLKILVKVSQ